MQLLATGFYWLPGFSNKINATGDSIAESYSIGNQKYCEKLNLKLTTPS